MSNNPNFASLLERKGAWMFMALEAGPFILSVQASNSHYSTPRENHESAGVYEAFEVAIFEGKSWVNPTEDERFSELKRLLFDRWESGNSGVGAYVPADSVQKLYDRCLFLGEEQPNE